MVSYVGIALGTFCAALIRAGYQQITGKPLFPANPKGPLYKWFGGKDRAIHEKSQEQLAQRLRDLEEEQISSQLDRRPVPRLGVSEPKP